MFGSKWEKDAREEELPVLGTRRVNLLGTP